MIIKMVNEFKLTVVHFARPNPMQICGCAWIYPWTKKLWKIRTGPRGRRGPWAAGHWAFGPSGRWAAGLLLAKPPHVNGVNMLQKVFMAISQPIE